MARISIIKTLRSLFRVICCKHPLETTIILLFMSLISICLVSVQETAKMKISLDFMGNTSWSFMGNSSAPPQDFSKTQFLTPTLKPQSSTEHQSLEAPYTPQSSWTPTQTKNTAPDTQPTKLLPTTPKTSTTSNLVVVRASEQETSPVALKIRMESTPRTLISESTHAADSVLDFDDILDVDKPPSRAGTCATFGNLTSKTSSTLVVITSCCRLFKYTRRLLLNLALIQDVDIDVVVVDDANPDGSRDSMSKCGINVIAANPDNPKRAVGLSESWNAAWKYFWQDDRYHTLYLLNNDVLLAHGTFQKMNTALVDYHQKSQHPVVVGPLTNTLGLGKDNAKYLLEQNIKSRPIDAATKQILAHLPRTLQSINTKLSSSSAHVSCTTDKSQPSIVCPSASLLGFLLGFTKDARLKSHDGSLLPRSLYNLGQEEYVFAMAQPGVVTTTFVYHDKGTTLDLAAKHHGTKQVLNARKPGLDQYSTDFWACEDLATPFKCADWGESGFCEQAGQREMMAIRCRKTCGLCVANASVGVAVAAVHGDSPDTAPVGCVDRAPRRECTARALRGECDKNVSKMLLLCARTCAMCTPPDVGDCRNSQTNCAQLTFDHNCSAHTEVHTADGSGMTKLGELCGASLGCHGHFSSVCDRCRDYSILCAWRKQRGFCTESVDAPTHDTDVQALRVATPTQPFSRLSGNVPYWVKTQCRRTCGLCGPALGAFDLLATLPSRRVMAATSGDPVRGCGDDHTRCSFWRGMGWCSQDEHRAWMLSHCAYSCGVCTG